MKTWAMRLQENYNSFEEFKAFDGIYNLCEKMYIASPEVAWEKNPVIGGSTNPNDFGIVYVTDVIPAIKMTFRTAAEILTGTDDETPLTKDASVLLCRHSVSFAVKLDLEFLWHLIETDGWCSVCEQLGYDLALAMQSKYPDTWFKTPCWTEEQRGKMIDIVATFPRIEFHIENDHIQIKEVV